MTALKHPALFEELQARGIVKQVTDPGLEKVLKTQSIALYCGFDPTADSLHVGSLLPLLTLRRFQLAGHRVFALAGGATGMIGDPSFKAQERTLQTPEQIDKNLDGIKKVMAKLLDLSGPNAAQIVNNADWFKGLSYIGFLRDVGKYFTVNHMMGKESVRARLEDREHGISYTEFSYMLIQAYDFYHLHREHGVALQIGGSDQWGNITAGTDLIRKARAHAQGDQADSAAVEVFGMTHPLVMKADGTKFGKTEQGTIWLDAKKTSPYQFYQFFIQTADADVMTFLKFFTFLPLERLNVLEQSLKTSPEKREAQTTLAREMTRLIHGEEELSRVEKASKALFGTEIRELDEQTLLSVLGDAPSTQKQKSLLEGGEYTLVDALVDTGLCSSKGAARKDLTAGGIYVNNERVADAAYKLSGKDLIAGQYVVLRKGKKTYHLLGFSA